jgi:hypothetical protein
MHWWLEECDSLQVRFDQTRPEMNSVDSNRHAQCLVSLLSLHPLPLPLPLSLPFFRCISQSVCFLSLFSLPPSSLSPFLRRTNQQPNDLSTNQITPTTSRLSPSLPTPTLSTAPWPATSSPTSPMTTRGFLSLLLQAPRRALRSWKTKECSASRRLMR